MNNIALFSKEISESQEISRVSGNLQIWAWIGLETVVTVPVDKTPRVQFSLGPTPLLRLSFRVWPWGYNR